MQRRHGMAKAYLMFNLDNFIDREEHENALNGSKYKIMLDDMDNWFRSKLKYSSDEIGDDGIKWLQEARDKLSQIRNELE